MSAGTPSWTEQYDARDFPPFSYTAEGIVFTCLERLDPRIAVIRRDAPDPYAGLRAWPGGFVDWREDPDAGATVRIKLGEKAGLAVPDYLEALDTYDSLGRDPRQYARHGARGIAKAFLGLMDPSARHDLRPGGRHGQDPAWVSVYTFLPWEDRRAGRETAAAREALERWAGTDPGRRARVESAFGEGWNEERAGERARLLIDARIVDEGVRDRWGAVPEGWASPLGSHGGQPMAFDHRVMLADALGRLRGKIKYLPQTLRVLAGERFPLADLYEIVAAIAGRPLDKPNFWRMLTRSKSIRLVEPTGEKGTSLHRPGPPAAVYRFVSGIEHQRLDPSLRFPWAGP